MIDDGGNVAFASDPLHGAPPMRAGGALAAHPETVEVEGLGSVRVIGIPMGSNTVLFAESLSSLDEGVSGLILALEVGVPILAAVLGVLVWLIVGRTLRPARVAMQRERRLVADVSHELRTPLAGARALLESESQVPAEIELNRLEALAVLTRLEAMANDLLVDARAEGSDPMRLDALVDLDDVALRVVDRLQEPPGVEIDPSAVSAGQVRGNAQDLERLIANLLSNALRHATRVVCVQLAERDGLVTLAVSDDGPGIAPEDRERVFERFARLDAARSRDDAGVGLGLSIARSVAAAHGGSIAVLDSNQGGATFLVTMPAAVASPRDTRSEATVAPPSVSEVLPIER